MTISAAFTTYEVSLALAPVANLAPLWQLLPTQLVGPRLQRIGLVRLSVTLTTAVATKLALITAATPGTATTSVPASVTNQASQSNGGQNPAFGLVATAWAPAPTFGATFFRQELLPAVVGANFEWVWPEDDPFTTDNDLQRNTLFFGIGVCLQNVTGGASAAVIVNARWKEFY